MDDTAALERRLASLAELLEHAQDGILVATADSGRFRFANRRICEMLGYGRTELLEHHVADIHPAAALPQVRAAIDAQLAGRLRTAQALPVRRKDGSVLLADISSAPVVFEDVPCLLGIFHDVSERLEAERKHRELHAQLGQTTALLEAVLDAIPDVIGVQDADHRVLLYNRAGYAFVGLPPEAVAGKRCYELLGEAQPCATCATSEAYRTGAPAQARRYVPAMDLWLDARSYPILDEQGRVSRVVEHLRDITSEVRALEALRDSEARLRQAHKLEAIGTLAGGIAHDFNNLLAAILGSVELLRLDSELPAATLASLETITQATRRGSELTQQLLGFARKGKLEEKPVDLNRLIADTLDILGRTVDRRIVLRRELATDPALVLGDPSQLQQILLNLGINARDAMAQGGELIFAARLEPPPRPLTSEAVDLAVLIEVRDTGTGMEPAVAERIFEPFFTTKPEGQGTGLGLAMVYGIVDSHHGRIEVDTEVGRGTTFRIWLPPCPAARAVAEPPVEQVRSGHGRVLLIEDEHLVRTVVAEMLRGLGFTVLTAEDGLAGLELFAAHTGEIDLTIVDQIMPRLGGVDCCRRIRALNPEARILIASGYAEDDAVRQLLAEGVSGFVQKPFDLVTLSRAVSGALGR